MSDTLLEGATLAAPETDPEVTPGIIGDRGGNAFLFSSSVKLHGVWDGCLVAIAAGKTCSSNAAAFTPLAHKLTAKMTTSGAAFRMPGDHHLWPDQWATDSLKKAVNAKPYPATLKNGSVQAAHGGDELFMEATIVSPVKALYVDGHAQAGAEQLLKAAVRLADLLNAIAWP